MTTTKSIYTRFLALPIEWVKGHAHNPHNNAAHRLARESINHQARTAVSYIQAKKKLSKNSLNTGSVEMLGQKISVRIISCEYQKVHRLWKYKYEVITPKSKYFGNVDKIFSEHSLDAGKSYFVRVNENTENPRIVKVYKPIQNNYS